jgi:flagellar hook-basal body complex protein FliE
MDISGNSLYTQMQGMSLQASAPGMAGAHGTNAVQGLGTESEGSIKPINSSSSDFGRLLKDAIGSVNEIQQEAGSMKKAFELGDSSVSLAQTMVTSQKAGLAFDATLQVRNKLLEAYKEIMSMPV